jgi:hypothetical protein
MRISDPAIHDGVIMSRRLCCLEPTEAEDVLSALEPATSARSSSAGTPLGQDIQPSYLHGLSARSRASSRHPIGKGHARATLVPDTVLPVYSGDRAIRFSRAVASGLQSATAEVAGTDKEERR